VLELHVTMAMPNATAFEAQTQTPSDRPSEQPDSGPRARRPAAAPGAAPHAAPARMHPDQEAMLLMMKVVDRIEVARSFAKIAAGILTVTAAKASEQLRVVADAKMAEMIDREGGLKTKVGKALRIVKAAKEAAVHVAAHRADAGAEESGETADEAPITQDPETQQAPAATAPHNRVPGLGDVDHEL